jgi:hypothetical protein
VSPTCRRPLTRFGSSPNPTAARDYQWIKQRSVGQGHVDLLAYSDAKGAHVAAVRDAARVWARRTSGSS